MTRAKRTTAEMLEDARKKLDEAKQRLAAAQERVKELEARFEKEEREAAQARWAKLAGGIEDKLGASLTTEQIELAMKAAIAALSGDGGEGENDDEGGDDDHERDELEQDDESYARAHEFLMSITEPNDDPRHSYAKGDDGEGNKGPRAAPGDAGADGQTLPIDDAFFARV